MPFMQTGHPPPLDAAQFQKLMRNHDLVLVTIRCGYCSHRFGQVYTDPMKGITAVDRGWGQSIVEAGPFWGTSPSPSAGWRFRCRCLQGRDIPVRTDKLQPAAMNAASGDRVVTVPIHLSRL
jgi:hypothetical protein